MRPFILFTSLFLLASFCAFAGPSLNVDVSQLSRFYYASGAASSASQNVVLHSFNLGSSNGAGTVTVHASSRFEVSLDNSRFVATVYIPFAADTLPLTPLYIRMKGGLVPGYFSGESIALTIAPYGSTKTSFPVSGSVTPAALTPVANTVTSNAASLTWTPADAAGADDWEYVLDKKAADPTTGTTTSAHSYTATGLDAGTNYYFHLRERHLTWYTPWTTLRFTTNTAASVPGTGTAATLAVIPNPSNGVFRVEGYFAGTGAQKLPVQVVNIAGQIVWSGTTQADAGKVRIDVSAPLPAGLYTFRILGTGLRQDILLRIAH